MICFIVGMPRSGTTLLAERLSRCSDTLVLPETHYFIKSRTWISDTSLSVSEVLQKLQNDRHFSNLKLNEREWMRFLETRDPNEDFLLQLLGFMKSDVGVKLVIEKTPSHLLYYRKILTTIPDAKIIYIYRDPRDVYLSNSKVFWKKGGLLYYMLRWMKFEAYASRIMQNHSNQYFEIMYEKLISDEMNELDRVRDFLDLRSSVYHLNCSSASTFSIHSEPWKSNATKDMMINNKEKWRNELCMEEQFLSALVARAALKRRGYSVGHQKQGRHKLSRYASMLLHEINLYVTGHFSAKARLRRAEWRYD